YLTTGLVTTDQNAFDSFTNHDVTSDSGDGRTHTEDHTDDKNGTISVSHGTIYAFSFSNEFESDERHLTHNDSSFDSFTSDDVTGITRIDGALTRNIHTGTEDENSVTSFTED